MSDRAAELAADVAKRRREVRALCEHLGRDYETEMELPRRVLRTVMQKHGITAIEALLLVHREDVEHKIDPFTGAKLVAACAEMAEKK